MAYKPDKRGVNVRCVTTAGVVDGTLHVARAHVLLDHVNHAREMLTLTAVQVRDAKERIPFFALRRSQTLAVIPPPDDDIEDSTGKTLVDHAIVCLSAAGSIAGTLGVLPNVRVSDYLQTQNGFFVLKSCKVSLASVGMPTQKLPVVLVNAALVVGVTEISLGGSG